MADFDKLIKEKAEKAEYPYKRSAWKRFAKRAGFRVGLSGWTIALVSVAVVAITAGLIGLHVTKGNSEQPSVVSEQPMANSQQPEANSEQSSVVSEQPMANSQQPKAKSEQPMANSQQPKAKSEQPMANSQQPTANSEEPKAKSQKPVYGPPIELNVDTITQMEPTDEQLRQGNSRLF